MSLNNKIDFAVIIEVKNANPNGDPLNGNRPRTDYNGIGEITDVCIKRKIRDRLLFDMDQNVFVQSEDRRKDEAKSLRSRAEQALGKKFGSSETIEFACREWFDVRAFGQLFAFKSKENNKKKGNKQNKDVGNEEGNEGDSGVSIPIRGPVSIQSAFSVEPVSISSNQITKSVNSEDKENGGKSSDTMGMKHRIDKGIYVFFGSMNPQLSEKTGFNDEDAEIIKKVLPILFENDASSARPEGSMLVRKVFWWKHRCKAGQYSSAKVHNTLKVHADGNYELNNLEGLMPEVIDGF